MLFDNTHCANNVEQIMWRITLFDENFKRIHRIVSIDTEDLRVYKL